MKCLEYGVTPAGQTRKKEENKKKKKEEREREKRRKIKERKRRGAKPSEREIGFLVSFVK